MKIDVDFHLHGYFSGGVSDKMVVPTMAEQSGIKGLDVVGTGDILHPEWRDHVKQETNERAPGIYAHDDCDFVLTTEVEDANRVHHVLLVPDFDTAEGVYQEMKPYASDIDKDGRPTLSIGGERIAGIAKDYDCLVGPAHAFTPYTAVYGHYDTLQECYGGMKSKIDFLELGLSADTYLSDEITDHNDIAFLSNSDAHSPWPHRMGREFNRLVVEELSFDEIAKAIHRRGRRGVELNVGFDPREGKYHCTACQNCHQRYTREQAVDREWTCQVCGKRIKKGVKDRIGELADGGESPSWRPDYEHLVPLAEIIREVVGHASVTTKGVQSVYDDFLSVFDSEIQILVDAPMKQLEQVNPRVARAVKMFRQDKTVMIPGGGGEYGELKVPRDEEERERLMEKFCDERACRYNDDQRSLSDF